MHDAAMVSVLETLASGDDEMHDFRDRQALFAFEDARIALAFDELHTDESAPILDAEIVDGDDVRMVERGRCAGFLKKLIARGGIAGELRRKNFIGEGTAQEAIERAINFSHPAFAD